jgi:hypothetical protein
VKNNDEPWEKITHNLTWLQVISIYFYFLLICSLISYQ